MQTFVTLQQQWHHIIRLDVSLGRLAYCPDARIIVRRLVWRSDGPPVV
jgi:hypothetical protein